MKTTRLFKRIIPIVLRNEGGFQDIESDPGNWVGGYKTGELVGTKYGISARFWGNNYDIPNLTQEEAAKIYYKHYYKPMNLEGISNDSLVLQVFDMGVNAGKRLAIRRLQKLIGASVDGYCGSETWSMANDYNKNTGRDIVEDYKHDRKVYYEWLADRRPNVYGSWVRGWKRRVEHTKFD